MLESPEVSLVISIPGNPEAEPIISIQSLSKSKLPLKGEFRLVVPSKHYQVSNTVLKLSFRGKELRRTSTGLYSHGSKESINKRSISHQQETFIKKIDRWCAKKDSQQG
jgi:hypothetical protein